MNWPTAKELHEDHEAFVAKMRKVTAEREAAKEELMVEVIRIIKSQPDSRSAAAILATIKRHLPDVAHEDLLEAIAAVAEDKPLLSTEDPVEQEFMKHIPLAGGADCATTNRIAAMSNMLGAYRRLKQENARLRNYSQEGEAAALLDEMNQTVEDIVCGHSVPLAERPIHSPSDHPANEGSDPVRQYDGKWWFWDECWVQKYGPYTTEEDARAGLKFYCIAHGI